MGTVPNRHPIHMSEIRDALGGANDLGWYRGRQYWDANNNPVTISQNPSMGEFPGLSTGGPINVATHYIQVNGHTNNSTIQLQYRLRTGDLWVTANNGGIIDGWGVKQLVDPTLYQSLSINYTLHGDLGPWMWSVDQGINTNDPDGTMIYTVGVSNSGIGMDIWVAGSPK